MIVTVTPNTAIDRTLFVPRFQFNRTLRATRAAIGMGGKAADAAWILGELGIPTLALGFAAGTTGRQMERMLQGKTVETDFTWVGGETRANTVLVEEGNGGQSTITVESLVVRPGDVDELSARYQAALERASCVVLGGTLPPGVRPSLFVDFIRRAQARGLPTVFDASGEALRQGLKAHPSIVKPNLAKLEDWAGRRLAELEDVVGAARDLQASSGAAVVVTLGEQGGLAFLETSTLRILPPAVPVVSSAGAGDGVLAGLAAAFEQGQPLVEGLRLGFAAAAAVLLTPGTADCQRSEVMRLMSEVVVREYP